MCKLNILLLNRLTKEKKKLDGPVKDIIKSPENGILSRLNTCLWIEFIISDVNEGVTKILSLKKLF
jgi:hypothetical protein